MYIYTFNDEDIIKCLADHTGGMMTKVKKAVLSKQEKETIERARDILFSALDKRLIHPADYDTNISCLRDIKKAWSLFNAVYNYHLNKREKAHQQSSKAWFGFFEHKAHHRELKEGLITEACYQSMFEGFNEAFKRHILKEPRIIALGYDFDIKQDAYRNDDGKIIDQTEDKVDIYNITFSDHSQIILHDVDHDSIESERAKFQTKMKSLETTQQDIDMSTSAMIS